MAQHSLPHCEHFESKQVGDQVCCKFSRLKKNSIAFCGAPRREADSQPISQLARPAVSQTETHNLSFLSVGDSAPSSGEGHCSQGKQWLNGDAPHCQLFGRRFEPRANMAAATPPTTVDRPGFKPPT